MTPHVLQSLPAGIVRSIDQAGKHWRIQTNLVYPDGSFIDLFIRNSDQLPHAPVTVLSDLGQTTAWLLDLRLKPWLSQKRKRFMEDALEVLAVRQNGGALETEVTLGDPLGPAILRLAQACLRVADLMMTQRGSVETVFKDRVEEFFSVHELPFDPDVEIRGRHGQLIRVDYRVKAGQRSALVLTLGPANASSAHTLANEIFGRWYELNMPSVSESKITVYDDECREYRPGDLERLADFSVVVPVSDEDALMDAVAA